jgi:hypothetical protein
LNWCSQAKVHFDDRANAAEPGSVLGLAAGDLGLDAAGTQRAPVLVVVVAAIGGEPVGTSARAADGATHRRDTLEERTSTGRRPATTTCGFGCARPA